MCSSNAAPHRRRAARAREEGVPHGPERQDEALRDYDACLHVQAARQSPEFRFIDSGEKAKKGLHECSMYERYILRYFGDTCSTIAVPHRRRAARAREEGVPHGPERQDEALWIYTFALMCNRRGNRPNSVLLKRAVFAPRLSMCEPCIRLTFAAPHCRRAARAREEGVPHGFFRQDEARGDYDACPHVQAARIPGTRIPRKSCRG